MSENKKTHDVFLSYSFDLREEAKNIIEKFSKEGLVVFDMSEIKPGENFVKEIWQSLAESWAVVVLIKPGVVSPNVAVEIGAASAWRKPIYVIRTESAGEYHVPLYFSKFEIFKISEIGKVIEMISKDLNPLSDQEREALIKSYKRLSLPTDKLFMEPGSIEKLQNILYDESHVRISGERIMQELLRLRKRGKLPRIRKKR
jgi:hypothetical protein